MDRGLGPSIAGLLFRSGKSTKVLYRVRDYELRLIRKTKVAKGAKGLLDRIPSLDLHKVPPKPVSFEGVGTTVETDADKSAMGFPFTTRNSGSLQIGFPRIGGKCKVIIEDPPASAALADEDEQRVAEMVYEQAVPGVGDITAKINSNREWQAHLEREVEDIGHLRTTVNSQFDWEADLDTSYPSFRGIKPSVTYGATQDGLRAKAKLETNPTKWTTTAYTMENLPGKYSPADFVHECELTLASEDEKHVLGAKGNYDRRFSKMPVRGSLSYTTKLRQMELQASTDFDGYQLSCGGPRGKVSIALSRADLAPTAALEARIGKGKVAAAGWLVDGKPRVRLSCSEA